MWSDGGNSSALPMQQLWDNASKKQQGVTNKTGQAFSWAMLV